MSAFDPQAVGHSCMGLHVRRAARRITRVYDEKLAVVELSIGQFSLLTMLAGKERWKMQPLADGLGTDRSSLTAMLKPLERRELVESIPDESDGRARQLAITKAGLQLLEHAVPLWQMAQDEVTEALGSENADQVRAIFRLLN